MHLEKKGIQKAEYGAEKYLYGHKTLNKRFGQGKYL